MTAGRLSDALVSRDRGDGSEQQWRRKGQEKEDIVGVQCGSEQRTGSSGVKWGVKAISQPGHREGVRSGRGAGSQGTRRRKTWQQWSLLRAVSLPQGSLLLRGHRSLPAEAGVLLVAALGPSSPRK